MGGNLFATPKINHEKYLHLISFFKSKFEELGRDVRFPESYKGKRLHGDLDIILGGEVIPAEELQKIFNLKENEVSRNTSVISILYDGAQVDLAFHPLEDFESAYNYYRNSDAGNLMGVMFKKLSLKFGAKGLSFPVKLGDAEKLGEVLISKNIKEILEFGGFDYNKWKAGFETPEELYEWITQSKFFNREFFAFEALSHQNRIRNRKRPGYAGFLVWLEDRKFSNPFEPAKNKSEYLFQSLVHFGNFTALEQINNLLFEYRRRKDANKLFNGGLLLEWTGLTGKDLGRVMAGFRENLGLLEEKPWVDWRLSKSAEEIKESFLDFYENS